jgi:hypothetical protein
MGAHPATGSHVSVTHISSIFQGYAGKLNTRNASVNWIKDASTNTKTNLGKHRRHL